MTSASASNPKYGFSPLTVPDIGAQGLEPVAQQLGRVLAGAPRHRDGEAEAALRQPGELARQHIEPPLGQAVDAVAAADQHRRQRPRQFLELGGETPRALGQLFRRDAMHRAQCPEHVGALHRIVARRHHQIGAAPGEARVLDLHPEDAAAAGALGGQRRRHRHVAAGDQNVGPGRFKTVARGIERRERVEPELRTQIPPGRADLEHLLDKRPAQRLGQAQHLAGHADLAVINRPHRGLLRGRLVRHFTSVSLVPPRPNLDLPRRRLDIASASPRFCLGPGLQYYYRILR